MRFREVNENDILKDLFEIRDEALDDTLNDEDKKHEFLMDEIFERVLNNIPKQNRDYVKKQFDLLDENLLDYLCYWNEKYYRNGFVDGVQMIMGCVEE